MKSITVKSYKRRSANGKVVRVRSYQRGGVAGKAPQLKTTKTGPQLVGNIGDTKSYILRTAVGSEPAGVKDFNEDTYDPFMSNLKLDPKQDSKRMSMEDFRRGINMTKRRNGVKQPISRPKEKEVPKKKSPGDDIWSRIDKKLERYAKRHGTKYKRIF